MERELQLERIENPDGHQVCQVDKKTRVVEIQRSDYMTTISFRPDGQCDIRHRKTREREPRRTIRG